MSGEEWGGRPWHGAQVGERVLVELVGRLDKVEGELALVRLDNGQVVSAKLADVVVLDRNPAP